MTGTVRLDANGATGVHSNRDATHTPFCRPCQWEGKPRLYRSVAIQAVGHHVTCKAHRWTLRTNSIERRVKA